MRRCTRLAVHAIAMLALVSLTRAPAADDKSESFTPLFNGRDFTGWKIYLRNNADNNQTKTFTVENGEIHCTGQPNGYMLTDKEYGDYVLRVQWRFPDKPGNSGVFVHVSGPDKIWPKGVEAQLQNGEAGDFWLVDGFNLTVPDSENRRQGRHFLRIGESFQKAQGQSRPTAVRKPVEKPVGEWNQYDITCHGSEIKLVVNGHHVNTGTHAEATKGHILLQSEGAPIVFRNIEIKSLK